MINRYIAKGNDSERRLVSLYILLISSYIFNYIYVAVRNLFFVKIFIVRIVNIAQIL